MKDYYITRKLGYDYVNYDDLKTELLYIYKLYKMNTASNRYDCIWKGVFFLDEIEEYDKLIKDICNDNSIAILNVRHDNLYIQYLCKIKMLYKKKINIYYEPDEV